MQARKVLIFSLLLTGCASNPPTNTKQTLTFKGFEFTKKNIPNSEQVKLFQKDLSSCKAEAEKNRESSRSSKDVLSKIYGQAFDEKTLTLLYDTTVVECLSGFLNRPELNNKGWKIVKSGNLGK